MWMWNNRAVDLLMRNRGARMMQTLWRQWTAFKFEMFVGHAAGRIQVSQRAAESKRFALWLSQPGDFNAAKLRPPDSECGDCV